MYQINYSILKILSDFIKFVFFTSGIYSANPLFGESTFSSISLIIFFSFYLYGTKAAMKLLVTSALIPSKKHYFSSPLFQFLDYLFLIWNPFTTNLLSFHKKNLNNLLYPISLKELNRLLSLNLIYFRDNTKLFSLVFVSLIIAIPILFFFQFDLCNYLYLSIFPH